MQVIRHVRHVLGTFVQAAPLHTKTILAKLLRPLLEMIQSSATRPVVYETRSNQFDRVLVSYSIRGTVMGLLG